MAGALVFRPTQYVISKKKNDEAQMATYHQSFEGAAKLFIVSILGIITVSIFGALGVDGAHEVMKDRSSYHSGVACLGSDRR